MDFMAESDIEGIFCVKNGNGLGPELLGCLRDGWRLL